MDNGTMFPSYDYIVTGRIYGLRLITAASLLFLF